MKKLKPILKPFIGCLNCGGGEMIRKKDMIICDLHTHIYAGMGGWCIKAGRKVIYNPPGDKEYREYPTLRKFELMARKSPGKDWRAICNLPLRYAEYQRQGTNLWVLVKTGPGFA